MATACHSAAEVGDFVAARQDVDFLLVQGKGDPNAGDGPAHGRIIACDVCISMYYSTSFWTMPNWVLGR